MADLPNEPIMDKELESVSGGLIAVFTYKCPICGAIEEKEIDTNDPYHRTGGDGWCDKCGVAMEKKSTRY